MLEKALQVALNKENLFDLFHYLGQTTQKNLSLNKGFKMISCQDRLWPHYVYQVDWLDIESVKIASDIAEGIREGSLPNHLLVEDLSPELEMHLKSLGFRLLEKWFAVSYLKSNTRIYEHPPVKGDLIFENVKSKSDLKAWSNLLATGWWGRPKTTIPYLSHLFEGVLKDKKAPVELYLLYLDDQPVAGTMIHTSDTSVGIYLSVTSPKHRQFGLGKRLMEHVLKKTSEKTPYLPIVSQSTQLGKRLFQSMGFKSDFQYGIYVLDQMSI